MSIIVTHDTDEAAVIPASSRTTASLGTARTWLATMVGLVLAPPKDRRGVTTIEYVLGIVAAITLVGVLIMILASPSTRSGIVGIIAHVLGQGNQIKKG